ncbi:tetratricopeptide repeat-containing sulfotransferase family protein [Litorimonas sp. RW-G-Af-16]|uniref:tetratricopeptide repeat-containing sulfotransferase family protein n=1 Tax=Litorimonas sp. RW-G-Af-16 TaxID=3241168 RepID=UPI00390C9B66
MTDTLPSPQDIQALMRQGRFGDAVTSADKLIAQDPKDIEALYMKAVSQRYLKDFESAEDTLRSLNKIAPELGRALQEEGHLARDQGLLDAALAAYQKATRANPALIASWRAQAEILARKGRAADAKAVKFQADRVAALPPALLSVTHLIHEGKLLKAEELCRVFLQQNPHHIEGMRLLADIGARFGVFNEADFLLESAIEFAPQDVQLRLDHIQILRKRQKFAAALDQAKSLYDRDPENPLFQSHLAIESMQTGDHEKAFELFEKVLEKVPNDPATLTSRGHAFKTFGKQDDAIESYRAAYRSKPEHGDAYFGLANLKTYRFTDDEIDQMMALSERHDIGLSNLINLCFSLGKAYEDREDFAASFIQYERGNDMKTIQSRYKSDDMTTELEAQARVCTKDLFAKQSGKGCPAPDPIFIVGLPRAGSTLLEQIIASHSQVDGTLELPNILSLSYRLRGKERAKIDGRYPAILHDLTAEQLTEYGEQFIEDTQIHRQGAPFFIDKMPNNFRHIGLIHLILPNAKIIDARRHPMACCFSGFKQHFAEGQEFTYGLENIGTYYRDYVTLMDHWDTVLPGKVLRVQYEDVVADTETQVRRILDYLNLPFEQSCLEFHKTKRSVRTASSEQVRQPIYKSGVDQWRNFEPWLGPLKSALGPVLERYPIDEA